MRGWSVLARGTNPRAMRWATSRWYSAPMLTPIVLALPIVLLVQDEAPPISADQDAPVSEVPS